MLRHGLWGHASALIHRARGFAWIDLLVLIAIAGLFYGLLDWAGEWRGPYHPATTINLDEAWTLPRFTFYSLARGLTAYVLSLLFTLLYGYWAAKDPAAERVLVPLLDILQSIPVLSFLPGLVLALVATFPGSNLGLELAAILMIFTGQAWNMTFSFYHSLRSVPRDLQEVAEVYSFTWWQRLRWLELPFSTMGLVWNSMMSMAGGWFFLMINEAFRLGHDDFRLPGLGSYMSVAVEQGRVDAMVWAIVAMTLMIVGLDQLFWRPVVVWAEKFRVEEGSQQAPATSWFLTWLRRSRLLRWLMLHFHRTGVPKAPMVFATNDPPKLSRARAPARSPWVSLSAFLVMLVVLSYGAWKLTGLLWEASLGQWLETFGAAGVTLSRVLLSTALGTLWAVPAGLAIGLSPRLSRWLQPVVQVLASFPAPMLFPLVIALLEVAGVSLGWGSILLMLLGTQWYILFNVVSGALTIPSDLREVARSYRLNRWQRFRVLYLPAIFPSLVTGWVTAAGGAWNASIVAEYVTFHGQVIVTWGLGAQISAATAQGNFPLLAASTVVMALVVVTFNRVVWRQLYHLAEQRFTLNR